MMRFDGQNPDEIALKLAHIAWEAGRVLRGMESALIDKRVKDDAKDVVAAQEFGMAFENYHHKRAGDVIEC